MKAYLEIVELESVVTASTGGCSQPELPEAFGGNMSNCQGTTVE